MTDNLDLAASILKNLDVESQRSNTGGYGFCNCSENCQNNGP